MQNIFKILLLESELKTAELLKNNLKFHNCDFQINLMDSSEALMDVHESSDIPDIIIVSYEFPGMKFLEVLMILVQKFPLIPIIVFGDAIGEEAAIECVKNGAVDYIDKKDLNKLTDKILKNINGSNNILEFEKTFSSVSKMLLKMSDKTNPVNESLEEVSQFVNVQKSRIFIIDNEEKTLSCVYEWGENKNELHGTHLQNIPVLDYNELIENFNNRDYLIVPNSKIISTNLYDKLKFLTNEKTESAIIFPVKVKKEVIGFSVFYSTAIKKSWKRHEISVLNVFCEILSTIYNRKKFEEELMISESRFLIALNVSPDPIVITSLKNGKIILVNEKFSKLSGYTQLEILGKTTNDFKLWHRQKDYIRLLNKLKEEGSFSNEEVKFYTKTGEAKIALLSATLITFYGETNVITFARDITDLVKAKKSLEKSEKRYRNLVESISEGIVMLDYNENLIFVNKAFCDITGFEKQELMNKSIHQFVMPEDNEKILNFNKRRANGLIDNFYLTFLTKTNEKKMVRINAKPIKNGSGEYKSSLGVISDITEKINAEKKLSENKERLDLALESANGGLIDFNIISGETYLSPHFYKMLGYDPDDFIASINSLTDLIHPEDSKSILNNLNDFFINHDESYDKEFRIKAKNGDWRYLLFRGDIIEYGRNKKPVRFLGVLIDITNRISLEEKLFNAKQHIQAVLDAVPGSVLWIGSNLKYQGVNRHLSDYLKMLPKDIVGKDIGSLDKGSEFSSFVIDFIQSDEVQITKELEVDFLGAVKTNLVVAQKYLNNTSAVFVGIDITEKKQTEEALQKTLKYSEKIVQTAPAIIIILDDRGDIIQFNDFAETLTGYKRDEVVGRNWFKKFIPAGLQENSIAVFKEIIKNNKEYSKRENPLICKNNTQKLISWYNSILHDDKGKAMALLSIGIDITEQKQLEEQFRQAQKMEAIGHLAGGIAHDFNNLLTAIRGYSQIAMMKLDENDPVMKAVKEISDAGDRAAALTRQLLTFSRKEVVKPLVLNPNDIIRNMQKLLSRLIGENIELSLILSKQPYYIMIDPGQLEQILMNLCVNARDAISKTGMITIETKCINKEKIITWEDVELTSNNYFMIDITDNGSGIEINNLTKIFDPFFTTKAEGKGTGLGLSTVYGIIKQNNGAINVYSEKYRGTTFSVFFPITSRKADIVESKNEKTAEFRGNETILIVEDTKIVRDLVKTTLQMEGYTVLTASEGGSALIKSEKYNGKIDLIITDVVMPEMNGPEFIERLFNIIPKIKVLYMSGYTDNSMICEELKKKDTEYIQKPFIPLSLLKKVRNFLDKKV